VSIKVSRAMGMGKGAKICAGVCCLFAVLFVVMVPVGLFVIAPNMAQSNLDKSTINITNATLYMPNNLSAYPWAYQIVHAKMHNSAPFAVTLQKFTQTMTMRGDYSMMTKATNVTIATYEFPETHLEKGDNDVVVKVNMTILGNDDCGGGLLCFNIFKVSAAMVGVYPGITAFLELASDDIHVKTMGLSVPGKFHSSFKMSCHIGPDPAEPLNVSVLPECQISQRCAAPSTLLCSQVESFATTTTTTTPSNLIAM